MTARGPILVTGAGGFVGTALATGLAALGHEVLALDRAFDALAEATLGPVPRITADLAQTPPALPACDTIIHAAALTTSPAALGLTDAQHLAANMAPLMAMIAHADRTRPRAFVFLSSSGVFAQGDGSPDLTDTDLPTATGPYSAAKKAGEALVAGALGAVCETFVLRLGYLYGPAEVARPSRRRVSQLQAWLGDAAAGRPLAVCRNDPRRDWTFAPDLAPAIARLVAGPGSARPLHLCAPEAVPDSVLAGLIRTQYPAARIEPAPARPAKAPMRPSFHPALEGFHWTPLAEGLARLAGRAAA
jgi:nucleoside-diphosphate-sugar epimerase